MMNHSTADAIKKLLPHAVARQEILYLLAESNPGAYQTSYDDCRHAVSYAYEAISTQAAGATAPPAVNLTKIWRMPPDPEGRNDDRAKWAAAAVRQFQSETGTEFEDALSDLLGDLMHFADRVALDFNHELSRARMHYEAETAPEEPASPPDPMEPASQDPPAPPPIEAEPSQATTTKNIYRAEFFTAADYAYHDFEADTPEEALQLARDFYDEDIGELDFRSYDDNAGIEYIQIWGGEHGMLAIWKSDDYCRSQAAGDLLAALNLILPHYAEFLRGVGVDLNDSEAYQKGMAAVAKATPPHHQA